eukprot:GHVS01007831.1.p1 GENE.GHVS01007831.1~~GHVS01007831.1.p1  ORF type:complete len:247 (+),score=62.32 GHVS01007831.1:177-917(+)
MFSSPTTAQVQSSNTTANSSAAASATTTTSTTTASRTAATTATTSAILTATTSSASATTSSSSSATNSSVPGGLFASSSAANRPSRGDAGFDCNICFDDVSEPVVTRCGHLFCWSCLHAWLQRGVFECPVCKAGVTQQNIIPLYGRGAAEVDPRKSISPDPSTSASGATPQRPRAERPQPPPPRQANGLFGGNPFLTFNVFPLGIGFTFPQDGPSRHLTEDEQRAQLVSLAFLVLGFVILFYLLLI